MHCPPSLVFIKRGKVDIVPSPSGSHAPTKTDGLATAGIVGTAAAVGVASGDHSKISMPSAQIGGPAYVKDMDTGPAKHTIGPHKSDILNVLDPRVLPEPSKMKASKTAEAKAETGPASHTIGPHQSDVLNVVDPRVLPQPDQQKPMKTAAEKAATGPAAHTIGPHKSDTLNVVDPRVKPEWNNMKPHEAIAPTSAMQSSTENGAISNDVSHVETSKFVDTGVPGIPGHHGPVEHATASKSSSNYAGATGVPEMQPPMKANHGLGGTSLPEHRGISGTNTLANPEKQGTYGSTLVGKSESDHMRPNMPGKYPSTASGL
jgi:hypothetical protein